MTCCRCPRLYRINYWINTMTWYNSMMEKGTCTGSQSVSWVLDVYNNTAQTRLFTVGPWHKHEWSPVLDQTDPPGGNHIWNILSKGESSEEVPHLGGWKTINRRAEKYIHALFVRPSMNVCLIVTRDYTTLAFIWYLICWYFQLLLFHSDSL